MVSAVQIFVHLNRLLYIMFSFILFFSRPQVLGKSRIVVKAKEVVFVSVSCVLKSLSLFCVAHSPLNAF